MDQLEIPDKGINGDKDNSGSIDMSCEIRDEKYCQKNNNSLPRNLGHSEVYQTLWEDIKIALRKEIGQKSYDQWISHMTFQSVENNIFIIKVPSRFIREFTLNNYFRKIRALIFDRNPEIKKVDIRIYEPESKNFEKSIDSDFHHAKEVYPVTKNDTKMNSDIVNSKSYSSITSHLNSDFTFENFVYGDSNKAAYFSLKQIAEFAKNTNAPYTLNILRSIYIHAHVGMGKTHLVQALANYLKLHANDLNVYYCTSEHFMYHYVQSVKTNSFVKFKSEFAKLDILILDDLQLIAGRSSTEKEFFSIFDHMISSSKTVIIASDLLPQQINLSERSKSRLSGCLTLSILEPDLDLKFRILKSKLQFLKTTTTTANYIEDRMLELIALSINSSIRELESVLHKVITYCDLMGVNVTQKLVEDVINEHSSRVLPTDKENKLEISTKASFLQINNTPGKNTITHAAVDLVKNVLSVVANYYCINLDDLISKKRSKSLSIARQIVALIAKEYGNVTHDHVGQAMGNRDHSTVVHMLKSISKIRDAVILNQISAIRGIVSEYFL